MQGIKRPELRDELYMQLLKQSRGNTTPSCAKVPLPLPVAPPCLHGKPLAHIIVVISSGMPSQRRPRDPDAAVLRTS